MQSTSSSWTWRPGVFQEAACSYCKARCNFRTFIYFETTAHVDLGLSGPSGPKDILFQPPRKRNAGGGGTWIHVQVTSAMTATCRACWNEACQHFDFDRRYMLQFRAQLQNPVDICPAFKTLWQYYFSLLQKKTHSIQKITTYSLFK